MEKRTATIERLQQLFADSSGYSIWILDQAGKLMTRPVFATEEGQHIYETSGYSILPMTSSLLRYGLADGPVIMDLGDSVWQIVSAVTRDRDYQYYYICAGPTKVDQDKSDLIYRTEQFKDLLADFLQQDQSKYKEKIRGKALERLAQQMQSGGINIDELDGVLTGAGVRYDYLGYASKTDGYQYKVSYTAGRLGDKLQGAAFFAGEGYLGQIAITGKMNWWTCKPRDPRLRFFAEHGLEPTLLYGYPVKRSGSTVGLMFYGIVEGTEQPHSDLHIHWSSVIGSLLGEGMTRRMLQANLELQTSRISTLIETAGILSSVRDLTRIMHLLIDMALTLFPDAQAAICLVKQPDNGKIRMMSRGLSENKAERLGKVLTHKYLQADPNLSSYELDDPIMKGTTHSVIAYPEDTLGVICIDLGDGKLSLETDPLLDTLSKMGAVAISQSFSQVSSEKSAITLLYDSMLQLDPAKSALVSVCREFAVSFCNYLQLDQQQLQRVDDAAALTAYEPEFLRSIPIEDDIIDILSECRRLDKEREGEYSYSLESRLLNCVRRYVASGRVNTSTTANEMDRQFQSFLIYREKMSRELVVNGLREDRDHSDQQESMAEGAEFASLSPREIDVLKLIAEGNSNKRIAETLFISEHTVKNHITNIFSKLGVSDRSNLIAMVYRELNQSRIAGSHE